MRCDFLGLYRHAVRYLARREYTRAELASKLSRYSDDDELLNQVLTRLERESHLSDARYARERIRFHLKKGRGPVLIAAELCARGVDENIVASELAAIDDWVHYARCAHRKKYPNSALTELDVLKQKDYLHKRGFSDEVVNQVFCVSSD